MREERGVAALLTVGFLAVIGGTIIAFMLASARVNDAYTLLYSAAQSAAYSASTTASVGADGEVQIPCSDPSLGRVRGVSSRCSSGVAIDAALEVLQAIFRKNPSGFCLQGYNCQNGGRPVRMRVDDVADTSLQIFNTKFNRETFRRCSDEVLGGSGVPIPAGQDGFEDGGEIVCWGLRERWGRSAPSMQSIQYSSGVIVRLETTVDLFAFRDRDTVVSASASVGQGE